MNRTIIRRSDFLRKIRQKGNKFITNIGLLQGDGASALLFIIYLAISQLIFLNKSKDSNNNRQTEHNYNKPHKGYDVLIPELF